MDEDFFSDDATLDALPENELQALEDAAVKGTQFAQSQVQVQAQQPPQRQQQYYSNGRNPPQHLQPQLPVGPPQQQQQARFQQRQAEYKRPTPNYKTLPTLPYTHYQPQEVHQYRPPPLSVPVEQLPSSDDYGFNDEPDGLWDAVAPEAQDDQQYLGGEIADGRQRHDNHILNDQEYENNEMVYEDRVALVGSVREEMMMVERVVGIDQDYYDPPQLPQSSFDVGELKKTVGLLEIERDRLQQQLLEAKNALTSKTGENTIIRSTLSKKEQEAQRVYASLENARREESERFQRTIDEAKAQVERLETEKRFLQKDNDDAEKQIRSLTARGKKPNQIIPVGTSENGMDFSMPNVIGIGNKSPATTPKKNRRSFALRDGFEDEEMISPSKVGRKTPNRKRKRSILDSPIMALPLSQSRAAPMKDKSVQIIGEALLEKLWKDDDHFAFFKAMVAHKCAPSGERTLEALSKFSFPSSPGTTLSSIFQDKITLLQSTSAKSEFSARVCEVILSIWSQCLEERLYGALYLILGLLQFGIVWDQGSTCHHFFEEAVDLIISTIDINAIPTIKGDVVNLEQDIDVNVCLGLLEGIALGLAGNETYSKRFWKRIRSDFPLIMLNWSHPLQHIQRMISILSTSCLGDSFGTLSSNETEQRANEGHLLDASSRLLVVDPPRPAPEEPGYSREQVVEIRQEIVQFFGGVAGLQLGSLALAKHQTALPRLARRIADELEEIYEFKFGRGKSVQFLNSAVRLLHGILTTHPPECAQKLAGTNTTHKNLVAMTRLAFSEGSVQETGIEEDVIDCAYSLLESMVTPNEAESLWALFHPQ